MRILVCLSLLFASLLAWAEEETIYRLGASDQLKVTVFGEEDLSGEFSVDSTGDVAFPLIGNVTAEGLSLNEFSNALRTSLADGYLVNPQVSVELLAGRPFYVIGEVNKPGQFAFAQGLTVLNAVALAEGFTPRARQDKFIIKRGSDEVNVEATSALQPGDTLQVRTRLF